MLSKGVSIPVGEKGKVSAVLCLPEKHEAGKGKTVVLAHGAGNDMNHPLIVTLARGLAEAGHLTVRFNFLYREKGRRAPDPQSTLVLTWQSVFRFLEEQGPYKTDEVVAAGKSMGGRVASQMAADGMLPADRLVFLGYPLHPPGRKDKRRDAHLYRIRLPMLFFAGTRDPLCHLQILESVLDRLKGPRHLEIIEGGDHSFRLRKSAETPQDSVYEFVLQKTTEWLNRPI
jgi:predicted alpha/beta-hydrolase family hydrolase